VFTQEHKDKISKANTGKKRTEKTKMKISKMCKGRVFSKEHKEKLSKTRIENFLKLRERLK
jgi:hypothetical protein